MTATWVHRPKPGSAQKANVVILHEAQNLLEHAAIRDGFLPPFTSQDESSAIFVRRGITETAENISGMVCEAMAEMRGKRFPDMEAGITEAWTKTMQRVAAVSLHIGATKLCVISLESADAAEGTSDSRSRIDSDLFFSILKLLIEQCGQCTIFCNCRNLLSHAICV